MPQPNKAPKGVKGQPPHEPTDAQRLTVVGGILNGYSQEQLAKVMGISVETLVKYYKAELDGGIESIVSEAAGSMVSLMRGEDPVEKFKAARYLLNTKGRWRTADSLARDKQDGEGGGPPVLLVELIDGKVSSASVKP
jgi:hypothetical protein